MIPENVRSWIREDLYDQVPVAIAIIDRSFMIVDANYAFAETFGEWEGRPCYEVYKGRKDRCVNCNAALTFEDGQVRTRQERGNAKEGKPAHYFCHVVPLILKDRSIPYVIEMSTDITQTKELEREKLEAERLATVGQTVAGLAHGVKNIIMGLEGGMYVVNSGLKRGDAERAVKGWRMLEEDIARISSFVKEFLDFARGRKPSVSMTSPNAVAEKVLTLFREKAAQEWVVLVEELGEGIADAPMDADGVHTCLTNLVLNAIDACLMSASDHHRVVVRTREEDGTIVFEVTDSGSGMDAEIKKKVFTSFFSTKASGRGTGLGLLTTKKIVQEHGGRVSFDSTEGEGSTFRLEFPRARLPEPTADEESPE